MSEGGIPWRAQGDGRRSDGAVTWSRGSGSQRCSSTGAWRSRSTRPAAPTRRRRIPATKCTWSSQRDVYQRA